jgi:hypothetical protein
MFGTVEVLEAFAWLGSAAGLAAVGWLGKWAFDIMTTRRGWRKEDRKDALDEAFKVIDLRNEDVARLIERNARVEADFQGRLARLEADHQARVLRLEEKADMSEQREQRCQVRLTRAEAHIRNLQYAATRHGMEFRKYEDDDSELDVPPGGVKPHGPPEELHP